jgi:hypothetical protein
LTRASFTGHTSGDGIVGKESTITYFAILFASFTLFGQFWAGFTTPSLLLPFWGFWIRNQRLRKWRTVPGWRFARSVVIRWPLFSRLVKERHAQPLVAARIWEFNNDFASDANIFFFFFLLYVLFIIIV